MINYSITARAVNPNLFEINQPKTRINHAKAEGKLISASCLQEDSVKRHVGDVLLLTIGQHGVANGG